MTWARSMGQEVPGLSLRCEHVEYRATYRVASIYGLGRAIYTLFFLEKVRSHLWSKQSFFPFKSGIFDQANCKARQKNHGERVLEVPESSQTVCRETEVVLGDEAQKRVGARVFCSCVYTFALDVTFSCLRTSPQLVRLLEEFNT